jgi:bacterial/archaeal transporter family-2 protein
VNAVVAIAAIAAGIGLAGGLAFNLRLAAAVKTPLAASLVNFVVGACACFVVWLIGIDGARPAAAPAPWMLLGGAFGASYVTLSLITAARLGVGVSTVAVTLGQVLGAALITSLGWFGQTAQAPSLSTVVSALLLLGAVAMLGEDRRQVAEDGGRQTADGR